MFQSITCSQYFIAISVCSFVYYLLVWFFYFNAKLPALRMAVDSGNLLSSDKPAQDGDAPSAQDVIRRNWKKALLNSAWLFKLK
jgi:hypothetical protein